MRIMNVYDNHLVADQVLTGMGSNKRRRSLADSDWDSIIESKVVLLRKSNSHCPD